MTSQC